MPTAVTPDGRNLHYVEAGAGEPVVVFESGMGASGTCWAAVQQRVADRTRAVAYDRSGLGRSPADHGPRTLRRLVDDLNALLDHLGAERVVLVGHSWGSPIVRVAAAERPGQVAGVVLVDPTDETCPIYSNERAMRLQRRVLALMPVLARLGILRLLTGRMGRKLPDQARRDLGRLDGSPATARAARVEFASLDAGLATVRADPPKLGDLPVTTISGVKPAGVGKRNRAALTASHAASSEKLPNGRHVLAEHSGHLVPLSQPDLVAAEVLRVVDTVSRPAGEPLE